MVIFSIVPLRCGLPILLGTQAAELVETYIHQKKAYDIYIYQENIRVLFALHKMEVDKSGVSRVVDYFDFFVLGVDERMDACPPGCMSQPFGGHSRNACLWTVAF